MNRSESITALRSEIQTDEERSPLPLEQFQNDTLRPILKFQNDIYVAFVKSYLENVEVPGKKHAMQEFLKLTCGINKNVILSQKNHKKMLIRA